jgi:hypothetical protein
MKNQLGCEMEFFAVRGMWCSVIIGLAIAALRPAGAAQALRYTVHKAPLTACCHLKFW